MSNVGFDATGITQKAIALEQDITLLEARNTMIKYNISRIVVVKEQILKSATEAVSMLLRIDNVLVERVAKKGRNNKDEKVYLLTFFLILLEQQRDLY